MKTLLYHLMTLLIAFSGSTVHAKKYTAPSSHRERRELRRTNAILMDRVAAEGTLPPGQYVIGNIGSFRYLDATAPEMPTPQALNAQMASTFTLVEGAQATTIVLGQNGRTIVVRPLNAGDTIPPTQPQDQ